MRNTIIIVLIILVISAISINFVDNIINEQINDLNANLNRTLGINIPSVNRGNALDSNIRAWEMFLEDINIESNIDIDFDFNDFAILMISNQNIVIISLLILVILSLLIPTLRKVT